MFIYIIFDFPLGVLLTRTFNFPPFKWFYLGSQFLWCWLSPHSISNKGESALRVIERRVKVPIPVLYGVWCLYKSIHNLFFLKLHVLTINNWTRDLVTPYLDCYISSLGFSSTLITFSFLLQSLLLLHLQGRSAMHELACYENWTDYPHCLCEACCQVHWQY